MSYYPAGYGQWPDPASYLPFSQTPQQKSQPQTQHPAPAYSYPPSAPTAQGPYTASQAAFNHNATQIPGLGAPGAGTPSHYQSPWQPPPNYAGYAQQTPTSHNPPSQTLPAAAANDTTQSPPKPPNDAVEEGELEEEDFDDLYEPQPADNVPKVPGTSKTIIFAQSEKDVDDAQDEAFYGAERGKVMSNRGGTPDRERSGSYSPYLSPREIDLGAGTSHDTSDAETGRAQQTSRLQAGTQAVKQVTNGVAPKDSSSANPTAAVPSDASSTPTLVFRSADEAKKEAQKSILRLLPLGVKLQNYIDEGLDENIVKSLFGDLNLLPPPAPAKPTAQSPQTKEPAATEASTTNSAKPKDQAEERKDRIARLLAAKAAKTAATAPPAPASSVAPPPRPAGPASARGVPSAPLAPAAMSRLPPPSAPTGPAALQNLPPPSAPTGPAAMKTLPPPSAPTGPAALRKDAGPSAASKAKSKTDKELLLKKKMEALLKAREAQAQQSAAAASAAFKSSASAAPGLPNKDANTDASVSLPEKPPAPIATSASEAPAVPSAQPAQKVASPTPTSSRAESTIPGLYLSTSVGSSQSSRKRPVAADFVDYKMSVGTPKRPFGQNRQDSFVIDISEDEESDQDVEMEVDSPAAGSPSSSSQQVDTSGRRGPSIKDFPPLSDGPYKRPLSRTSSNGPRPAKLHQLSGEISSLQRKIAELEARKAKKSSSGAQTPSVAVGTPIEFPESAKGLASDPKINGAQAQTTPHEAESSGEADGADLASAQLISEAASASLPQRIGHSKNAGKPKPTYGELGGTNAPRPIYPSSQSALPVARAGSEDDRRVRITSIQLPKIEATLLEKKTKLKLLEQKTAQLRLEIEKEAAEKEKLAEELRLLDEGELVQAVSASRDSELAVPSVAEPASTVPPSQTDPRAERDSLASNSISEPTKDSEPVAYGADGSMPSPEDDTATAQPMDLDDEDISTPDSPSNPPAKTDQVPPVPGQTNTESSPASDTAAADAVSSTPATEPNASPKPSSQPIVSGENRGSEASTPESGQVEESEPERPSSAASQSPRRPDEVGDELSQERDGAAQAIEMEDGSPVPATISGVSGPSSNETEQAQEMGSREGPSRRKAVQLASFTPYESPLKNFRSYRFHPEYANNVPGGLKSLTYTNKINPNQELCLDELIKGKCEDPKCGFQHFASMKPKDDYILLELGRADEFAEGEEKKRFIGGLRDLLAAFRTEKVRNYDKIGYGIIEYRRKFIGDDSRVLSGLHNTKI